MITEQQIFGQSEHVSGMIDSVSSRRIICFQSFAENKLNIIYYNSFKIYLFDWKREI